MVILSEVSTYGSLFEALDLIPQFMWEEAESVLQLIGEAVGP